MPDTTIDNPVLNSPYAEPDRHFRFGDDGITDEIVAGRRPSAYFVPIPPPRKCGRQLVLDTQWAADRIQPNDTINRIRDRVGQWRRGGFVDVTPTTRRLLAHWTDAERDRRLFFYSPSTVHGVGRTLQSPAGGPNVSDYHINIFYGEANGGYIADIPDLRHCSAFGKTPAAALAELSVAREAWLAAAHAAGIPTPTPRCRPAIYQVAT